LETAQAESNVKLTEKAHEMAELFKKVEELEEENFTMKGQVCVRYLSVFHRQWRCLVHIKACCVQLLERVNEEKVELVEEAPLQAVSVSHVHAAPTHRVADDQVEELLEENRRLMDEVRLRGQG
jgi:hypothetical protein